MLFLGVLLTFVEMILPFWAGHLQTSHCLMTQCNNQTEIKMSPFTKIVSFHNVKPGRLFKCSCLDRQGKSVQLIGVAESSKSK